MGMEVFESAPDLEQAASRINKGEANRAEEVAIAPLSQRSGGAAGGRTARTIAVQNPIVRRPIGDRGFMAPEVSGIQ